MFLLTSSLLLIGQLPALSTLFFSIPLSYVNLLLVSINLGGTSRQANIRIW